MQIPINDDLTLDSRRALWMPKQGTLVVADLFFGMGAARRRRPDPLPGAPSTEIWERLFALISDYQPSRIAILGDLKPNQGTLEGDEAEELHLILRKLTGSGRELIQVVGHPERSWGPALEGTAVRPVETYRLGNHTLMHRRRIFVYPRHEPPQGHWINGGLHPLFAVPTPGPAGEEGWLRTPAFLHTGFALVMPPFVTYAQGWEVMQPERLPRQARAWKVFSERIGPLDLTSLPPAPEALKQVARPIRSRPKAATSDPVSRENTPSPGEEG